MHSKFNPLTTTSSINNKHIRKPNSSLRIHKHIRKRNSSLRIHKPPTHQQIRVGGSFFGFAWLSKHQSVFALVLASQ